MTILSARDPVCRLSNSCIAVLMLVALTFPTASPRADDTLGDFEKAIQEEEREDDDSVYDGRTSTEDTDLELTVAAW